MPGSYEDRISRAAGAVGSYLGSYEDEVEIRDALIVEALDAGELRQDVARWAQVSTTRVTQIVARRVAEAQVAAGV